MKEKEIFAIVFMIMLIFLLPFHLLGLLSQTHG